MFAINESFNTIAFLNENILLFFIMEVEFHDNEGRTYAMLALEARQLMVLHYELVRAA